MKGLKFLLPIALILVSIPFGVALADDDFEISLDLDYTCDEVGFVIDTDDGTGPFLLTIDFGDEDEILQLEVDSFPHLLFHTYPGQGEYEISVKVIDSLDLEGEVEKEIAIEGPKVTLESDPFPPLLPLEAGEATVTFTAQVEGGTAPITFEWDLDGDDTPEVVDPSLNSTEFTYTEAGKFKAKVRATDDCGFSGSDKLTVVILDDEEQSDEEREGEQACHPMAEKIAQALSGLTNVVGDYDCNAIYAIFRGTTNGGATIGFGRLWHAYKMATVIPDLTWEEIRDWKLEGNSWGLLNQISRFVETVDGVGIKDLMDLVLSGDNSVGEIRAAMRMTLRYEVEFEDALGRISEGASNGELGQLYKLAEEMGIEPSELDGHLEDGTSLSEVRQAFKLFGRTGIPLEEILTAHGSGSGWGEINQAHRLAVEGASVAEILEMGVNEYRKHLREEGRLESVTEREVGIAARFGEKYGASPAEVLALYNGDCDWKWACVRKLLRDQIEDNAFSDRDARTLDKIANQYGVSPVEVSAQLEACDGNWACVRTHFKEISKAERGNQ